MHRTTLPTALLAALAFGAAAPAGAFELVRVADSSMAFPGGSTLLIEASEPAPCDLGVVFYAVDFETLASGIFVATPSGVEILVDETTPVPAAAGTLRDLDAPDCDGTTVVFRALDSGTGLRGLYRWSGGAVEPLVVQGAPVPEAAAGVVGLASPELAGERVVFGTTLDLAGLPAIVSVEDGALALVVAGTDPVPGSPGGAFLQFSPPSAGPSGVTFAAGVSGLGSGIYRAAPGGLSAVATRGAPLPGGAPGETFDSMGEPRWSADGSAILFSGRGAGGPGIFSATPGGTLRALIPPGAPAPSGAPFLEAISPIPLARGFAFMGQTEPLRETLYVVWNGRLQRIVGAGDLLDGQTVANVLPGGRGDRLAVRVLFLGNSQALYTVELGSLIEVPALRPVGVGVLVLLLGGAGVWRLRRGAKIHEDKARHA